MKAIITFGSRITVRGPNYLSLEVQCPTGLALTDGHNLCEWLFQQFNRGAPGAMIDEVLDLNMSSVSVGDEVEIILAPGECRGMPSRLKFRCASVGWEEVALEESYAPEEFARSLDISQEECQQLIRRYVEAYPALATWMIALGENTIRKSWTNEEHTQGQS